MINDKLSAEQFAAYVVNRSDNDRVARIARGASEDRHESEATRYETAVISGVSLGASQSYELLYPTLLSYRKAIQATLRVLDEQLQMVTDNDGLLGIAAARRVIVDFNNEQRRVASVGAAAHLAEKYTIPATFIVNEIQVSDDVAMSLGMAGAAARPHGFIGFQKYGVDKSMECHCPVCYGTRVMSDNVSEAEGAELIERNANVEGYIRYGRFMLGSARETYMSIMDAYDSDGSIDPETAKRLTTSIIEKITGSGKT